MSSLISTFNLFNVENSNGAIKFYEYNSTTGNYDDTAPTNQILFDNTGDITLDSSRNIILDADGGNIMLKDANIQFLKFTNSSGDTVIYNGVADKDIIFKDLGSDNEIMRIDGSAESLLIANNKKIEFSNNTQYITSDGTNLSVVSGGALLYTVGASSTWDITGDLTMDVSGDIILDADGDNITMKAGGLYPLDFIHSNTGDWTIKNTTQDKDIIFNVNDGGVDTEIMRIDGSSSNIGINTSTPQIKLDILDSSNPQLRLTHTNNTDYIDLRTVSNSNISSLEITTPDSSSFIKFFDNNSGSVSAFISSVNSDTVPFLSVGNTSSGALPNIPTDIENGFRFLYNTSGNFVLQRNNGSSSSNDIMTFERSTGNIGIGTTNPSSKLQVIGEITSSSFTDGITKIYSGTINNISYLQATSASFTNLYGNASNLTGISTKSITDGNTSVICSDTGTGSISFIIDNNNLLNLVSSSGVSARLNLSSPDANSKLTLGVHNDELSSGDSFIYAESGTLSFGAHNTEIIKLFNNSGTKSVCIGTSTSYENYPLTVEGNIISVGNTASLSIVRRDTRILSWTPYSPQGDLRFYSQIGSGTLGDVLTIQTSTGNIGVGITNPSEKLYIEGGITGSTITDGTASLTNGELLGLLYVPVNTITDGIATITNFSLTNINSIETKLVDTNSLIVGSFTNTYNTFYKSQNDGSFQTNYNGSSYYNIPNSDNKTYGNIITLYIKYTIASDASDYAGLVYTTSSYKFGIQVHTATNDNKFIPFVDTENPHSVTFVYYIGTFSSSLPNNQYKGNSYEAIVEYDFTNSGTISISSYFKGDSNAYSWEINDTTYPDSVVSGANNISLGSSEYILLGYQHPAGANYFKGTVSDFRIIEKSLTAEERYNIFYNRVENDVFIISDDIILNENNNVSVKFVDNQMSIIKNSTNQNLPLLLRTEQNSLTKMGILGAIPYINASRTDSNPSFLIDGDHYNYGFGTISFRLTEGGNHTSTAKKRYDIMQNGNHSWYNNIEKEILSIKNEVNSPSTNTVLFLGGDSLITGSEVYRSLRLNQTNAEIYSLSNSSLNFNASSFYFKDANVGINTTSPDRKLEILDNTNPQLRLTHTDSIEYIDFKTNVNSNISSIEISAPDTNSFIRFSNSASNNNCLFIGGGENQPLLSVGNNSGTLADIPNDINYGFRFMYNTSGNLVLQRRDNSLADDFVTFKRGNDSSIIIDAYNNNSTGYYYGDLVIVQRNINSYNQTNGGLRLINPYSNYTWCIFANVADDLNFNFNGTNSSYINDTGTDNQQNFTGQHRSFTNEYTLDELQNLEGLIVCANKNNYTLMSGSLTTGLDAITTNEALPDISLCTKDNDKTCFGILSNIEDSNKRIDSYGNYHVIFDKEEGDTRPYINSIGEGGIWVSNKNGNLESGDFITTSSIPGYGMKQNDELQHNYTVAKITMSCDFIQTQINKKEILKEEIQVEETKEVIVKDENGEVIYDIDENGIKIERKEIVTETITKQVNVLDNKGFVQFVDTNETENKYRLRYLLPNGIQITESEYNTKLANNEIVYLAAFVGCTYHCG